MKSTNTSSRKSIISLLLLVPVLALCLALPALSADGGASAPAGGEMASYYIKGGDDSSIQYVNKNAVIPAAGLYTTLTGNDALVLRRVVDLRNMTKDDSVVTILPLAAKKGQCDFTKLVVDIVDVYDENNYVTFTTSPYPGHENDYNVCYTLINASNGQAPTALDRNGVEMHVRSWGSWTYLSLAGVPRDGKDASTNYISYTIDLSTLSAYVKDADGKAYFASDLDDIAYYGSNCWSGFTTGEVYVRVRLDDYLASKASFIVTQYGEYDMAQDVVENDVPPVINIDYGDYTEDTVPEAVVGKTYTIFPAKAIDLYYGNVNVDVKVYTNFYSTHPVSVNVKKGTFTPAAPVDHYIVYTAEGSSAEAGQKVVKVPMNTAYKAPSLAFADFPTEWTVGDRKPLPAYTCIDGSGVKNVSLRVTNGSTVLPTDNGTVQPVTVAPMVFTYTVTDFLGVTSTVEKTVTVKKATVPTFTDLPRLPDSLIEGVAYTFPTVNAYDFVNGNGTPVSTSISVVYNGATTAINGSYTPAVANNLDTVKVVYTATVGSASSVYEKTLPVYKVKTDGKLDMTKYFDVSGAGSVSADKKGVYLTGNGETTFRFINAVGSYAFSTNFLSGTAAMIDRFDIILTDIADPQNQLKFTYAKSGDTIVFYVNDDDSLKFPLSASFAKDSVMGLTIDLGKMNASYDVNSAMTASVKKNLAGAPFTGFTDNKAYLSYHMTGANYKVGIQMINNQFMSSDRNDYTGPSIDVLGNYGGQHVKGDRVALPEVMAVDVLTGDTEVFVSVQDPFENYILEEVPLSSVKDEIEFTEYGMYYFEFVSKDQNGRKTPFSYVVSVVDEEAPVFSEIAPIPTVKVGEKLLIKRPTVTDNVDKDLKVTVYICYPGGSFKSIGNYDGIIPKTAGEYTVIFEAIDSFGNRTTEVRQFTVLKGE